jgi:hypothetical protein
MTLPTDTGFRIMLVVTVLVAVAVLWVGLQTGDWTGIVLVVPLAALVPIVARLPAEPPNRRRRREQQGAGNAADPRAAKDDGPRRD